MRYLPYFNVAELVQEPNLCVYFVSSYDIFSLKTLGEFIPFQMSQVTDVSRDEINQSVYTFESHLSDRYHMISYSMEQILFS